MKNLLHIYAQEAWHDSAFIVGDIEALCQLKFALERALERNLAVSDHFVDDGEGFQVRIMLALPETMEQLCVPYTDEMAKAKGGLDPEVLFLSMKNTYGGIANDR